MEAEESAELEAACEDLVAEEAIAQSLAPSLTDISCDPSLPPYPRGLVLDLALKTQPVASLLVDYGLTPEQFKELTQLPVFRHDMLEMRDKIKEEGFSFRIKAQAQAEQYLQQAWKMVHDPMVPANVRADLVKWTAKVAGLEQSSTQASGTYSGNMAQMAEQLKALPDGELEMRVMSIVLRNAKADIRNPQPLTLDAA
jgi:hypothetical protein